MNTNKIATGSVNKKLLAALAVLAVAFVVLAAVPAVATDSDAAYTGGNTVYVAQEAVAPTGTTVAGSTSSAPLALSTVITSTGIANDYSDVTTIYIVGQIENTDAANKVLKVSNAVTIRGYGDNASISGYVLDISATSGIVTIRDLALSDRVGQNGTTGATYNGKVITSTAQNSTGTIALRNIDITSAGLLDENTKAVALQGNFAKVDIDDSSITTTHAVVEKSSALYVIGAKELDVDGTTFTGFNRAVFYDAGLGSSSTVTDAVLSVGTSKANTYEMSDNGDAKVINIGTSSGVTYSTVTIDDSNSAVSGITSSTSALFATSTSTVFKDTKLTTDMSMTVRGSITLGDATFGTGADLILDLDKTSNAAQTNSVIAVTVTGALSISGSIVCDTSTALVTDGSGSIKLAAGATVTLDADQNQPETLTAVQATEYTLAVGTVYPYAPTAVMKSGSLELTSGNLYLPAKSDLTLQSGTFTVASGAAVLVSDKVTKESTTYDAAKLTNNGGSIVNHGTIAYQGTAPTGTDLTALKLSSDSNKIVKAYAVTDSTADDAKTEVTRGVQLVYPGEEYTFQVAVNSNAEDYKVGSVTASTYVKSGSSSVQKYLDVTDNGDGTYTITVPKNIADKYSTTSDGTTTEVANTVDLVSAGVGAYSVSYYLIFDDGTQTRLYTTITGLISSSTYTTGEGGYAVANPSVDGYAFAGWYTTSALNTVYAQPTTFTGATIYGKMQQIHTVKVTVDGTGSVTPELASGVAGDKVTLTITADANVHTGLKTLTVRGADVTSKVDSTTNTYVITISKDDAATIEAVATFEQLYTIGDKDHPYTGSVTVNSSSVTGFGFKTDSTATSDDGVVQVKVDGADFTTGTYYSAGESVQLIPAAATGKALSGLYYYLASDYNKKTMADKTASTYVEGAFEKILVKVDADDDGYYYIENGMPAGNIVVYAEFGTTYTLKVSVDGTNSNGSITSVKAGSDVTAAATGNDGAQVAEKTTVVLGLKGKTVSNVPYGVSAIAVKVGNEDTASVTLANGKVVKNDDGTYSFDMPAAAATVTVSFAQYYSLTKVSTSGGGSIDYDKNALSGPADTKVVISYANTTSDLVYKGTTVYKAGTTTVLAASITDGSTTTVNYVLDETVDGQITITLKNQNIDVVLNFEPAVPYTVTYDADPEGGSVAVYENYGDDDQALVASGSQVNKGTLLTIVLTADDNRGIVKIGATYTVTTTSTNATTGVTTTRVSTPADQALDVVSAPKDNNFSKGVYTFSIQGDTTITAEFAKTALQTAKDDATAYIESVRTALSENVMGGTQTWAEKAEADGKYFSTALTSISGAISETAVDAAKTTFNADLLSYLQTTTKTLLDNAVSTGVDGVKLDATTASDAEEIISQVTQDKDGSVINEAQKVLKAYDDAMTTIVQYAVAVKTNDETMGTVTASVSKAKVGDKVTFIVSPKSGFQLDTLTINGEAVAVTGTSYEYTMTAADVEAVATFTAGVPAAKSVFVSIASVDDGKITVSIVTRDGGYIPSGDITLKLTYETQRFGQTAYAELTLNASYTADGKVYAEIVFDASEVTEDVLYGTATYTSSGVTAPRSLATSISL